MWRGEGAGGPPLHGVGSARLDEGWKTRAVVRMPGHTKIRPSTPPGYVLVRLFSLTLIVQNDYADSCVT